MDTLDLYTRATTWTAEKVRGATDLLDHPTPCDDWDVRALINHMIDTQRYFTGQAKGEDTALPAPVPPDVIGDAPADAYDAAIAAAMQTYNEPGAADKAGFGLGIAFSDSLLHGWDLATATSQDATMPDGLPAAALSLIHGKFTPEQRPGVFKPEIEVPDDAPAQVRLLAYTGRR